MRVIVKFNEYVSNELREKVSKIKTVDDFFTLVDEYGIDVVFTAFIQTHENNNEQDIADCLENYFINDCIYEYIENALEDAIN